MTHTATTPENKIRARILDRLNAGDDYGTAVYVAARDLVDEANRLGWAPDLVRSIPATVAQVATDDALAALDWRP